MRRGVLLLDLVIAMLILAAAFMMALGMIPFGMRANAEGRLHAIGLHLAEQEMEHVIYGGYNQAHNYNVNASFNETTNGMTQAVPFTTQVTVQKMASFSNQMYQVDVCCEWTYASRPVSECLETMLYTP
jgi:hypothetical protein